MTLKFHKFAYLRYLGVCIVLHVILVSVPSLLIESTTSMIMAMCNHQSHVSEIISQTNLSKNMSDMTLYNLTLLKHLTFVRCSLDWDCNFTILHARVMHGFIHTHTLIAYTVRELTLKLTQQFISTHAQHNLSSAISLWSEPCRQKLTRMSLILWTSKK